MLLRFREMLVVWGWLGLRLHEAAGRYQCLGVCAIAAGELFCVGLGIWLLGFACPPRADVGGERNGFFFTLRICHGSAFLLVLRAQADLPGRLLPWRFWTLNTEDAAFGGIYYGPVWSAIVYLAGRWF